ncbi:MAG: hypothetical protein KGN79_10320 [Acidobacteriota bacterium]|nr:hypothetical protein [Acidobacteriota bacterium]
MEEVSRRIPARLRVGNAARHSSELLFVMVEEAEVVFLMLGLGVRAFRVDSLWMFGLGMVCLGVNGLRMDGFRVLGFRVNGLGVFHFVVVGGKGWRAEYSARKHGDKQHLHGETVARVNAMR